jgi:hypothetical protein
LASLAAKYSRVGRLKLAQRLFGEPQVLGQQREVSKAG